MGRSILAIVTGFVVIGALSFGADAVLKQMMPGAFDATGRVNSVPVLLLIMAYVAIFAIAGCYLAARLAPNKPMRHALILGVLGLIFNIAGSAAMWNTAPAWFHLVSLVMVMPYAWIGGKLRENQIGGGSRDGSLVGA